MTSRSSLFVFGATVLWLVTGAWAAQFDTPNRAFHNAYAFRLEGRHQTVACETCHINQQFRGTPKTCYDCHWIRRKDDRYQARLGSQCEQCHRPTSWTAVVWDHGAMTGTRINAEHRQLGCEGCHRGGDVRAGSVTCIACHRRDYDATRSPAHAAAGFPTTCDSCHSPGDTTWRNTGGGGFNHAAVFPLVGVHATEPCTACHRNNVYRGTARDCVGCHQPDYSRTQSPNHATAGFSTACDMCHRATDPQWRGASFNHASIFPLVGVHATQTCIACHQNNVYRGTARDCLGCHQADYSRAQNPNHATAGFSTTCDMCHRATDPQWRGASFNHNQFFALLGVHASQQCATCHANNVYRGTARTCVGCHQTEYSRTTNPNHVAAGFPTTCESCHRPTDSTWRQGTFNHTQFPLTGRHSVACAQCHTTPTNFAVFSCTVCHDRTTTDSKHRGNGAYRYDSNACYACHPTGRT